WPRKYFDTTMLVACCDQNRGISTSRCSKTSSPFSLPMTADRISHSTSSNGSMPSRLKKRSYSSPGAPAGAAPGVRAIDCGVVISSDPAELWLWPAATPFCIVPPPRAATARPHGVTPTNNFDLLVLAYPARTSHRLATHSRRPELRRGAVSPPSSLREAVQPGVCERWEAH